ncbi:MAG: ABC transporter ATP-binding protein [Alphaproteobacteria bacterium]|nr:ABC transporter ATP-binding protein [Alphaproteobacteria bacterium]
MTEPAIRVEGLTKHFGAIRALDGIDFTVEAGATMALLGGNGAGKTTTLAILLGLLLPTSGRATVLGADMRKHRYRVLPRMNFSSPYVDLPRRLTAVENLTVYARLYGVPDVRARLDALARDLDLGEFLHRPIGSLSSGQRTRVALAKALVNTPDLLLLDEPTASLDPDTADWVRGYLERYRQQTNATILLASHNMAEVERLCDDVAILQKGRIVDRGSPQALIAHHGSRNLEEVFLTIARSGDGPREGEATP